MIPGRTATPPWTASAPRHWRVQRLKSTVTACQNGVWGDEPDGHHDVICVRVADFDRIGRRVRLERQTLRAVPVNKRSGRTLRPGDLLIEKSGGGELQPVGTVVLYEHNEEAICSNFVARMSVAPGHESRFLTYLHQALYGLRVPERSIKQTTGIQNLDSDQYLNEKVAVPPPPEQRAIADFLDRRTSTIDGLSNRRSAQLAALKERARFLIDELAGQRADRRIKLKHVVDLLPGFSFPSDGFVAFDPVDSLRLLRGVNVGIGSLRWVDTAAWPSVDAARFARYQLAPGDLVLGLDRPWIGDGLRLAEVRDDDVPSLLLQRVARLRARAGLTQDFLRILLLGSEFTAYFEPIMTGVSVPHISPEQVLDFEVPLPPVETQIGLCRRLNKALAATRTLVLSLEKQLANLAEYRQALITAAVTGQLRVDARGAA